MAGWSYKNIRVKIRFMKHTLRELCGKFCDDAKENIWFFEISIFLIIIGVISDLTDDIPTAWNQPELDIVLHELDIWKFLNRSTGELFIITGILTLFISFLFKRSYKTYLVMLFLTSAAVLNRVFSILQGETKSSILVGAAVWIQILILQTRIVSVINIKKKKNG